MKPTERRKRMLAWLEAEGTLSLAEMVDHFGVSKMTIHRDLNLLEQRKNLKRIHGGVTRVNTVSGKQFEDRAGRGEPGSCLVCFRPPSQQLLYTITLKSGEQKLACCAHCGISAHLLLGEQMATAMTADFLTGRLHSAQHSFFVMGSVAVPCCKPSMLTFADGEMAGRFQAGFGGTIGNLQDALAYLERDMNLHASEGCPHCAAAESGRKLSLQNESGH